MFLVGTGNTPFLGSGPKGSGLLGVVWGWLGFGLGFNLTFLVAA